MSSSDANRPFGEIDPSEKPLPLTEGQWEFYQYLRDFVFQEGYWPTYEEIREAHGFASSNSVTQRLKELYSKGWIDRVGPGHFQFRVGKCPFCGSDLPHDGSESDLIP